MQPGDTHELLTGAPAVMSTNRLELEMDGALTARALQALRFRGAGPPYIKIGKAVRYPQSELLAWRDSRMRTSTSDNPAIAAP